MTSSRLHVRIDERLIDRVFRDLDTSHLPGAAVGIAIGGNPVYRKGFGLASMDLPVTLTPGTRMRIYSMTKHFTCLAYLLLCEEGKAGLDDPIGKFLPELHPITHRVTMRQLMNNTSGLRDACEIRWAFSGIECTVPASDLLTLYRDIHDVNFNPGDAWCYNNGGFHILSAVIEKLAERRLEEVFRERIFEPVGMHNTLLRRVDTDFIGNSATMHMTAASGRYHRKYLPGELVGEGGIVSTVDDILLWLRHMARPVVGNANTWAYLMAGQSLRDGGETGYGLGLLRGDYQGVATISHSGGGLGNNSQMIKLLGDDIDVVVVVNRHDVSASDLVARIVNCCISEPSNVPGCSTGFLTGAFSSPTSGRVIQLYVEDGKQMALVDGTERWPLLAAEDHVLRFPFPLPLSVRLTLRGDPLMPDGILEEYFGRQDELLPVRTEIATDLESISGEFHAPEIGVQMKIRTDSRAGTAVTVGRFGSRSYRLERICERLWQMSATDGTDWGGVLATRSDGMEVILRTPRTWHVRFAREQ